jgi:chromosome segregation protein
MTRSARGEARLRRRQEITKEISGWKLRLETAEADGGTDGTARGKRSRTEITSAASRNRHETRQTTDAIEVAEARRKTAADRLAEETALRETTDGEREAGGGIRGGEARAGRAQAGGARNGGLCVGTHPRDRQHPARSCKAGMPTPTRCPTPRR